MKQRSTIKAMVLAAITSGILFVPVSNAAPMGGEEHQMKRNLHGAKLMKKMARQLDLTEEQMAQIKAIRQQGREDSEALRSEMKAFRDQVKTLKDTPEFDEQAFSEAYQQYQETFMKVAMQKAKSRHAMYQVLTEEQRLKWESLMQERQNKRQHRRG